MPVKVHCPTCDKELNAPDDLLGKTVACPRCNERFPVEHEDNGGSAPQQNLYPPGTSSYFPPGFDPPKPPVEPPPPPRASVGAARFLGPPPELVADAPAAVPPFVPPTALSPPSASSAATPPPAPPKRAGGPPAAASGSRATVASFQGVAPAAVSPPVAPSPGAAPVAPSPASAPARFKPAAQPERRTVKSAKFVTAGEAATHMKLGADGQLPQLHLREGEQQEKKVEEKLGVNPLIVVALLVSVAASVAMLVLPEDAQSESKAKAAARKSIEDHYTETPSPIDPKLANKPYQYYLGQALQAHNRGDYPTELRNYRHVMNLLHSEGISKVVGLTGRIGTIDDPPVPSDRHLEQQLTILLSD